MSSFLDPLILEDIGDRTFRLVSAFRYHVGGEDSTEIISAPAGFITDFASIPRIFWNILPPYGKYGKACVIHDALYQHHGFGRYTRKQSDDILLEGMEILGVSWITRHIIYRGVRIGGWAIWNKTRVDRKFAIVDKTDFPASVIINSPHATVQGPITQ